MFCECEAASPCFSNLKTRSDSRAEPSVCREAEHVNYCICLLGEACLITCQAFSVPISVHQANICWDSPDHNEGRMLLPRWPRRETFSENFWIRGNFKESDLFTRDFLVSDVTEDFSEEPWSAFDAH